MRSCHSSRLALSVLFFLPALLAGCAGQPPAPSQPQQAACPAPPACPVCPVCPAPKVEVPPAKPFAPARWEDLPGWREDKLVEAHAAFIESCKSLGKKTDWSSICTEARRVAGADNGALRAFYESALQPWQLVNPDGSREGLITGYYEPVLRGSRARNSAYRYGVYGVPRDLLQIDLTEIYPELKGKPLRGRLEGRRVVPYYSRAELTEREPLLQDNVLYWVEDPVELFFLQIQGSGQIELKEGGRVRVGYADQNGYPYKSIGRWLADRGELSLDQASMQGIKEWARANPTRLDELLNANPSYIFFRPIPLNTAGPIGAQGLPLTPRRSIAVDSRTTPLGAPVFLATTWPNTSDPMRRLMIAQDTGGAIRGPVRADFYWGTGPEAGAQAGRMKQKGQMWVLLPKGAAPE